MSMGHARRRAESRMLDTFQIGTFGEGWEYDPFLDAEVREFIVAFETKARVKAVGVLPSSAEVGGRTSHETRRELHIPATSPETPPDAVARCTAVHETTHPPLFGAYLSIEGPAPGSQTTDRRLTVTEVTP